MYHVIYKIGNAKLLNILLSKSRNHSSFFTSTERSVKHEVLLGIKSKDNKLHQFGVVNLFLPSDFSRT